jgi:hypothetical protein
MWRRRTKFESSSQKAFVYSERTNGLAKTMGIKASTLLDAFFFICQMNYTHGAFSPAAAPALDEWRLCFNLLLGNFY